jgi:hypothetical protein
LSDSEFLSWVKKASNNDTYFFTENQLFTAYCSKFNTSPGCSCLVSIICLGLAFLVLGIGLWPISLLLLVFSCFKFIKFLTTLIGGKPSRTTFTKALDKWLFSGYELPKLIRANKLGSPPPDFEEGDIYDYGVERLLIVEHDILVDLLVFNNLHAQERMLVVSLNGYPDYLIARAAKLLEECPDLPVFLLHDSTEKGRGRADACNLPLGDHPVINLGISRNDVEKLDFLNSLHPEKMNYELPVDSIPQAKLAALLTDAMVKGVPFAHVLPKPNDDSDATGFG